MNEPHFKERFLTQEFLHHPSPDNGFRHPFAALYDRVFSASLPAVVTFAERKNVALENDGASVVLHHALKGIRRTTMRWVLNGHEPSIRTLQIAIDRSLDLVAVMRLISLGRTVNHLAPLNGAALVNSAEEVLRNRFANDKGPAMQVWADSIELMAEHVRSKLLEKRRPKTMILPADAGVRVIVRLSGSRGRS